MVDDMVREELAILHLEEVRQSVCRLAAQERDLAVLAAEHQAQSVRLSFAARLCQWLHIHHPMPAVTGRASGH